MSAAALEMPAQKTLSPSRLWLKAMELTARIEARPSYLFTDVIADWAAKQPDAPALLSNSETLTYAALSTRSNRYARWALAQGVKPGDHVALVVTTRPDYIAAWTGITAVGGIVALINTQLTGESLAHALRVADAAHLIVSASLADAVRPLSKGRTWILEDELDAALNALPGDALSVAERPEVQVKDKALLIYTSGTTGLPKAAHVSHHRIMSWGHWFAGLMNAAPDDRLYDCLPIHHSVGGVVAITSMITAGGSVVLAEKFSARRFWADIVKWDCTVFQYIGELCRYLLKAPPSDEAKQHRLRLACGNGLRGDVWEEFQARFGIPRVLEFYAATEGNFSLFNVEGKPGSIGRIPPFISHRFPAAIVKFDTEAGKPLRGEDGLCIPAGRGEAGEALGRISGSGGGGRFEGYTNKDETERKILRDVLEKGDAWFRTGDLMRMDEKGFYYFVDRIGDTFRWKGENVATAEVAAVMAALPGIADVNVYGVAVPGADGRAGMAAIVREPGFYPQLVYDKVTEALPAYARPLFLRLRTAMDLTETFKQKKTDLVKDGFAPSDDNDPVLILDHAAKTYVPLTPDRFEAIMAGQVQL